MLHLSHHMLHQRHLMPHLSHPMAQLRLSVKRWTRLIIILSPAIIIILGAPTNVWGQLCGGADTKLCRGAPGGAGHVLLMNDDVTRIFPRCVSRSRSRTAALCPRAPSVLTSRRSSAGRRRSSSHRQSRRQSATGGKMRKDERDKSDQIRHLKWCFAVRI